MIEDRCECVRGVSNSDSTDYKNLAGKYYLSLIPFRKNLAGKYYLLPIPIPLRQFSTTTKKEDDSKSTNEDIPTGAN